VSLLPFRIQDKNRQKWQKWIGDNQAFTLAEILVAMAVFALIILIIGQIFIGSSTAISQNNKSMSALDASQAVFQQIGLDISKILLRDDVDYSFAKVASGTTGNLAGNDSLSFYARTTGLTSTGSPATGTPRTLSVVKYQVAQNATTSMQELDYGAQQIDWDNSGSNPLVLTSVTQLLTTPNTLPAVTSFATLAPEVVRMEICFQLVNDPIATDSPPKLLTPTAPVYVSATSIPQPIRNLAGILVGIVVIDSQSRVLLPSGVDLKVAKLFPDAVANEDLLSLWTPDVTVAKLEGAGVPARAVQGIHVYQKYFPLPR